MKNEKAPIQWMDAHCHLSEPAFDEGREDLYAELLEQNITGLVLAGTDPLDWHRQENLNLPPRINIARVFGIHPWNVDSLSEKELDQAMATLSQSLDRCVGLGEMGLDYFRAKSEDERAKHRRWFDAQLDLAKTCSHPLVLHVVKAHHESVPQLRRHQKSYRGLVHSYWAHADVGQSYIDLGFILSVPPRIMKEDPHQILKKIDPDHIVFETDTPFVNAEGVGMKPGLIRDIMQWVASARGESLDVTANRQSRLLIDLFPVLKGP